MGKPLHSTIRIQEFSRTLSSDKLQRLKRRIPTSINQVSTPQTAEPRAVRLESDPAMLKMVTSEEQNRTPLAKVVSDCVNRWFQDTLKEAKAGDVGMQVLVGQMYYSGYGVPRDAQKGQAWINKAAMRRSSVWEVCDKQPGYNASDSDSDEFEG